MKAVVALVLGAAALAACSPQAPSTPAASAEATTPAPAPATQVAAAAPAANAQGEHVYRGTCSMCHGTGAGGAPMFKSKDDWGPRIAQGKDTLYQHALNGFTGQKGTMPPHGGNPSLSESDVKAAVDYMVSAAS